MKLLGITPPARPNERMVPNLYQSALRVES
jgi:hypothetical protein